MPVSQALKQRLVQQFQQKKETETLAAQASRAAAHSDDQPRSSGSKPPGAHPAEERPSTGRATPATARDTPASAAAAVKAGEASGARPSPDVASHPKQQHLTRSHTPQHPPHMGIAVKREQHAREQGAESQRRSNQQSAAPKTVAVQQQRPADLKTMKSSSWRSSKEASLKRKESEVSTTPLEILRNPGDEPQAIGEVPATTCTSYSDLWTAVGQVCGDHVNRATARLVYQDKEGDWMALLPGIPFSSFSRSIKRLLVICTKETARENS